MITVFTPTYNRADKLKNLYKSLLCQKYKNFEWLIIDDGSTDNTKELIQKYKKENKLKINYIYKENHGKMSAVNLAHNSARGSVFITIDSDDELVPDILESLNKDYDLIKNKKDIAGIVYLAATKTNPNTHIGDAFPNNLKECKYTDLSLKYKIKGDKATLWKTSVLKNYSFPIIEDEKFVPDLYLMMQISKKYNILVNNKIVMLVEYLQEGYTNNYFKLVKNNPKGTMLFYKELYNFKPSLYSVYGYILFSIYAKKNIKEILKNHKSKFKVLLLYFPTLLVSKIRR